MILVLLIEERRLIGESLAVALSAAADLKVQHCSTTEEALCLLAESAQQFDVVLLKQSGGLKAVLDATNRSELKEPVLVITPELSDSEQRRLAGLGVAGIFPEQRSLDNLVDAIGCLSGGHTWFNDHPSPEDSHAPTLSQQETRVAELVLAGFYNKEIGPQMGISESRVKALLQRVFLKLGVHTRGQLVRVLLESKNNKGESWMPQARENTSESVHGDRKSDSQETRWPAIPKSSTNRWRNTNNQKTSFAKTGS
jgi:DNA-binding NarL/FixJ family response regulator